MKKHKPKRTTPPYSKIPDYLRGRACGDNFYPLHHEDAEPLYVTIPQEEYDRLCKVEKEWNEMVEDFHKAVMPMEPYYTDKFCPRCGKPLDDKRWRKFSEENPKENDYYLVTNGDFVDFEYGCYNEQDEEWNWDHNGKWKWWMPLPMLPEEGV